MAKADNQSPILKLRGALRSLRFIVVVFTLLLLVASSIEAQTVIKLESGWQLLTDKEGKIKIDDVKTAQGWRDARVGLSWNAQFADLRDYMGVAWYQTKFDVPQTKAGEHVLIRFGAVDYFSEVYVNGKRVGEHEGGYTPFIFDITDAAQPGANELVVRVVDPPMDEKENRARFPEMMYNEIPHGKQNWYVQTGGIWQGVTLEVKPETYIKSVRVVAKNDGRLSIQVVSNGHLGPPPPAPPPGRNVAPVKTILDQISVRVIDPQGKAFQLKLTGGGGLGADDYVFFEGKIPNPQLWSVDHPNLYTVEATLGNDRMTDRFGFRSFEARDGHFYLNNEPFYMIAALDQDFYPETIYTPPSEEFVRDEMLKAKRLGLNTLRCHIKVPDSVYLKIADEVGLLIWYEIPSWNDFHHFTPKAAERGEKIFAEQVARDWNHPAIVIQSIINESWGADLKRPEQRQWLRAAFDRAKKLTGPLGRLIVDNSACCDNFHVRSDIDDFHQYFSIPDHHEEWDRWVADFATRPKWTFTQNSDAERTGQEPLVVSEFGNWGLPILPKSLPWWFERDFAGREVTRPAGLFDRFREFRFNRLFRGYDELATETEWHQFISLKHEIEEMRRYASIQGYVITEFTDINWESNGLMDMWRKPKVYADELAKIQKPDVIIARLPKANYLSGERVEVETLISHYSNTELNGAIVDWSTSSGAHGQFKINGPIERAGVRSLETLSFVAPNVNQPRREKLSLELRSATGQRIAENSYQIFIFPKDAKGKSISLAFYDPPNNSKLSQSLAATGYKVSSFKTGSVGANSLLIATSVDSEVERYLQSGGRALVLADSKEALPLNSSIKLTPRAGSDLDGNWVTNFNWVKADAAPFKEVAFTKILGFESDAAVPRYVIQGIRATDYDDVLAGIFYGWLNDNAALAVQMNMGRGRMLVTTFRFDEYGNDPYTTHLLDAMIRYAGGSSFNPKLNWAR
ncbi:MAG TPA: hypothetical protein VF779_00705 [Pyrinomonadaceae bacterium]